MRFCLNLFSLFCFLVNICLYIIILFYVLFIIIYFVYTVCINEAYASIASWKMTLLGNELAKPGSRPNLPITRQTLCTLCAMSVY